MAGLPTRPEEHINRGKQIQDALIKAQNGDQSGLAGLGIHDKTLKQGEKTLDISGFMGLEFMTASPDVYIPGAGLVGTSSGSTPHTTAGGSQAGGSPATAGGDKPAGGTSSLGEHQSFMPSKPEDNGEKAAETGSAAASGSQAGGSGSKAGDAASESNNKPDSTNGTQPAPDAPSSSKANGTDDAKNSPDDPAVRSSNQQTSTGGKPFQDSGKVVDYESGRTVTTDNSGTTVECVPPPDKKGPGACDNLYIDNDPGGYNFLTFDPPAETGGSIKQAPVNYYDRSIGFSADPAQSVVKGLKMRGAGGGDPINPNDDLNWQYLPLDSVDAATNPNADPDQAYCVGAAGYVRQTLSSDPYLDPDAQAGPSGDVNDPRTQQ
jgi:hypothetical protein